MCLKASPSKPPVTSVYSPTGWQVFAGGCWLLLGEIGGRRIRNLLEIDLVTTDCHGHPQFEWMTTAFLLTLTIYSLSCSEVCSEVQSRLETENVHLKVKVLAFYLSLAAATNRSGKSATLSPVCVTRLTGALQLGK